MGLTIEDLVRPIGMCKIPEHHLTEDVKIWITCWKR